MVLRLFLSCGGLGFSPYAPGTLGTLAGVPLVYAVSLWGGVFWHGVLVLVLFALGVGAVGVYEKACARHDPSEVVLDEVLGYGVSMLGVPLSFTNMLLGFVVFRLLDIFKPWPISWIDRQKSPASVMADDVAAGLATNLIIQLLLAL